MSSKSNHQATSQGLETPVSEFLKGGIGEQTGLLRLIADAMPALIAYVDDESRYQFINKTYEVWFGLGRDEAVGRTISEVLGREAQNKVEPYVRRVLAGEDLRFETEIQYRKAGRKWVEARYIPDFGEDGDVRGFFALIVDITERKDLEAKTLEQFEELENIYSTVPVGLAVIDTELRFVRVNDWLAKLNGVPASEHAGRPVREVVPQLAEKAQEILSRVIETGEPVRDVIIEGEAPGQPAGQRAWSEIWTPVKNSAGETIAVNVVVEDVTESRWAETLMTEQNRLFEMIAAARPLETVLTELTAVIDRLQPNSRSVVLVADRDRCEFEAAYAANIPDTYVTPLRGIKIEETPVGTCCAAVYRGEPVTSTDVASDIRWTDVWRNLCLSHDIKACHSEPIFGEDGRPMGTVVLGYDTPREPDARGLQLARLGARVAGVAVERARAEEDRKASESEYRTLFESIDEGYCVVEVIVNENEKPVDYRFIQINPAFAAHTGLPVDSVGKTARELVQGLEDRWVEVYGRVALTGESVRFENGSEPMGGRWFDVYALRVGEPGQRRVGILFNDITERKARERALASAASRDEFRVRLSDSIRGLKNADAVKIAAAKALGERLGVNRATYAEVRGDDWLVVKGFEQGVLPMRDGRYSAKDFGTWIMDTYRAGERIVFNDTATDPRFSNTERAAHAAVEVIGAAGVPLIKAGELVAILTVHTAEPREWTEDELALIEETAQRTWDAVERVRAEADLRLSEERLRLATAAAGIYTWEYDPSTGKSYYSPNMQSVLGFELPENTGNANLYIHPHDRDRVMGDFAACLDGHTMRSEYRFVDPATGKTAWVATHGMLIPANGRPGRALGITQNITERKRAEEILRASHDTFRLLVENSPFGIYVVDADFKLAQVAAGAQKVFQNVDPLIGRDFAEVIRTIWEEPFATEAIGIFRRALETGEPYHSPRTVEMREDTDEFESYDWRIERIVLPDGRFGVVCHFYDLSERIRYELELREAELKFRSTFEQAAVGMAQVDPEGRWILVNDRLCEIVGYTREELLDLTFQEITHPDDVDSDEEFVRQTLAGDIDRYAMSKRYVRKDGELVWVNLNVSLVRNADGSPKYFVSVVQDITESKRGEAALRESEERYRFLDALGEATRTAGDPATVMAAATRLLGEHLAVTRCAYADVDSDSDRFTILDDWRVPGASTTAGVYSLDLFGTRAAADMREGRVLIIRDVDAELTPEDGAETFNGVGIKAIICCPLVKEGRLKAMMAVHNADPRDWTDAEVALVRDTAERSWAHIERIGAAAALRESEKRFRNMADNAPVMIWVTEPDGYCNYLSESWYEYTGQTPQTGLGYGWLGATHTDDAKMAEDIFRTSNAKCEPFRAEYRLRDKNGEYRWVIDSAQPRFSDDGVYLGYIGSVIDIHERKEAEELRRRDRERFDIVRDGAEVGFWFCDLPFDELIWDNRVKEHFWFPPDARVTIDTFYERIHPDDRERTREAIAASNANKTQYDIEYRTVEPTSGREKWIRAIGRTFYDKQGEPIRFDGVTLDITQQKHAEDALRAQTELLRAITESTPDLIFAKDASGRLIMANKATLDVMGHAEATAIGRLDSELYDPHEADLIMANDRRVMQSGQTETIEEVVTTDGDPRTYLTTKNPLRDAEGQVIGLVGVSHNITALKRAETALRDSETRHRLALESGNMGTWTMPMDGRLCWADEQTLALFDIPAEEWTGDAALIRARRLPEDQEEVNRTLAKAITERSTWRSEFRVRRRDGSIRWLAGVGRIEFGHRGEPVLMRGINFDITERKQAEEELRSYHEILEATVRERTSELAEANRQLEKENRERRLVEVERQRLIGQLVAAQEQERRRIAQDLHDHLGQQLTALNLKLELALQAADDGAAGHLHDAKAMMRQIDDDVDALAWQLRPAILDDDGFLPALRKYVEDWSRRCGIPAELWADGHFENRNGLSPEAETNLYRITQEALNNVAKYANAEHVEVLLNKRGHSAVLTVQDNGAGFDMSASVSRTEKSMGLVGMRERAGLVGGTFQIESAPGEGTAIYVRVPFTTTDGQDGSTGAAES